jgi:hypothetical protein
MLAITALVSVASVACSLDCPKGLAMHFTVSDTKPNGDPWDTLIGPAPDPRGMVTVTNPDGVKYNESVAQRDDANIFDGVFFRKKGVVIKNGARVVIYLVDDDAALDDPIGTSDYVFSRVNSILNGGTDSFSGNSFSGSFKCAE